MPFAVIITALPVEYLAVRKHLKNLQEVVNANGTVYERGYFAAEYQNQSWEVGIMEVGAGNSGAALEVERAVACFQPDVILFVGIAGGIRDVKLGDVVATTKIYGYESGKSEQDFKPRPEIGLSAYSLEQRARAEARKDNWLKRLDDSSLTPRVFVAPIAAGEKVVASTKSEVFKFLQSTYGDAVAVEMEGFGFLEAARANHQVSTMVIRGISDLFNDTSKADRSRMECQQLAAKHASAFAFEVLAKIQKGIHKVIEETTAISRNRKKLTISKIELYNIRCFKNFTLDLAQQQQLSSWLMLLGDNAIGKSTILKSIALGLCNESDAAALIKVAESSGELIKKGEKEGRITIHLRDSSPSKLKKYIITTTVHRVAEDAPEIVRQETQPAENFPWADIFVCGYGAYRSKQADTSYEQYKAIDAVKSLFDHQTSLQNPELISLRYLRQNPQIQSILEEKLLNILMLDPQTHAIHFTTRGLEIDGPWGRMPLQNLSDGYRSTTIWILDFIGWLLHAERLLGNPDIGGILIIDEIEQHLHPRWQRHIVQRLRQQFPKTQIIASTHTPLVAAGIADVDQSMLLKLERNEENEISLKVIDKEQVAGKRADQVLTSDAFGLYTTRNERSHDDVDRYTKLLGKKTRNNEEEDELQQLRPIVQSRLSNSESPVEQSIEKAVKAALHSTITNVSPEMLDIETKKQLQALFHPEN